MTIRTALLRPLPLLAAFVLAAAGVAGAQDSDRDRFRWQEADPEALAPLLERAAYQGGAIEELEQVAATARHRAKQVERSSNVVDEILATGLDGRASGELLNRIRDRVPDIAALETEVRARMQQLAEATLEEIRLREEKELAEDPARREEFESTHSHQQSLVQALTLALDAERELLNKSRKLRGKLARELLRIGSAEPIGPRWVGQVADGARWISAPDTWTDVGASAGRGAVNRPVLTGLGAVLLLALILARRPLRKALPGLAPDPKRVSADSMWLTSRALLFTLLLALPTPAVLVAIGSLVRAGEPGAAGRAIASALVVAGVVALPLAIARQLVRRFGVADAHFGWNERLRAEFHRPLRWLLPTLVAAAFVTATCEASGDDEYRLGLGRLAFLVASLALTAFVASVLRPERGFQAEELDREGTLWRLRKPLYGLAVLLPAVSGVASAAGYQYAAVEIQSRVFATGLLGLLVAIVYGTARRWLLVARRRLAVQQARQRLESLREERERRAAEAGEEPPAREAMPDLESQMVDVHAASEQTLALVRTAVVIGTLVLLYVLWRGLFPALDARVIEGGNGAEESVGFTWLDVLGAAVTLLLTFVAARSLPSVLELAVLSRLRVDNGMRYTAKTLTRYAVVAVGLIAISSQLQVDWSKMQWIVAALGVGLGFGLQEIVANFVSGLIILFERPIRVGDTVTVGEDSGTVTRLQIRATTITDWDNKEILVPNKSFITDRVVNWTLSNQVTRLMLYIGVAYGSNLTLAREAIMKGVKSVPSVLDDPAPSALFCGFGDSSLDFEVRIFIDDLSKRLQTMHDVNFAIHEALREAGVAIPFPQRDLHLKSGWDAAPPEAAADVPDED